jgi:hypothetical protein
MSLITKTKLGLSKGPFNSIESLGQINFQYEGLLIKRTYIEGMNNFLGNCDVIRNSSPLNESMLRVVNRIR